MRELIKMTLAGVGEVVGECEDGADAPGIYARLQPDWVLMDVEMESVDGIAATKRVIAAYPKARVMIVIEHDDRILTPGSSRGRCQEIRSKRRSPFYPNGIVHVFPQRLMHKICRVDSGPFA